MSVTVEERPWGKVLLDEDGQQVGRIIKDRREFVRDEDFSLEQDTLVGSWFHVLVGGDMVWQGVVVAEPQAGRYLCHIDQLADDAKKVQRVFSLDTLMGYGEEAKRLLEGAFAEARAPVVDPHIEWRLYDSESAAIAAYQEWATSSIEREPAREIH
jgi:hypothetical protein